MVIYCSGNTKSNANSSKVLWYWRKVEKKPNESSLYFLFLSVQTHNAHSHKHIYSLQLLWQECLKMTWSDKEDWPNPRQSVAFPRKVIKTKCLNLSWGLGFQALPAFLTHYHTSCLSKQMNLSLLWFSLFSCPVLIFPKVNFWFCCFYSWFLRHPPGQDIYNSENILFWDQFTCSLF